METSELNLLNQLIILLDLNYTLLANSKEIRYTKPYQ